MFRVYRCKLKKMAVLGLLVALSAIMPPNLQAQEARKLLVHPTPGYPDEARKFGLTGVVKVQVVIAPDGRIREMKILGGHPMLAHAAEDTLKGWKYAPAANETTAVLQFDFHP